MIANFFGVMISASSWGRSFTSDGGHPDCEVVAPLDVDEFKEQEDELRRIELEAEVRKLEETLEYQRQMENEAKQRQLAEQHKKLVRVMNEGFVEDEVEPKIDDQPTSPQLKAPMQVVFFFSSIYLIYRGYWSLNP